MSRRNVTEAEAERAIAVLKRGIEAAENSNQAGENFVVAAANVWEIVSALRFLANAARATPAFMSPMALQEADHILARIEGGAA